MSGADIEKFKGTEFKSVVDDEMQSVLDLLGQLGEESSETNILAKIDTLACELAERELDVAQAQGELERATDRQNRVKRELMAAMEEARQKKLSVASGYALELTEKWKGSITKLRAKRAFKWLRDHGHGSLINSKVIVTFKTGQDAARDELIKLLQKSLPGGKGFAVKEAVHFKRLEGLIAELAREGKLGETETELLSAYPVKQLKMKKEP